MPEITPFVNQELDRLTQIMQKDSVTQEKLIEEYLERHQNDIKPMQEGVDYYFKRNEIIYRRIYKYDNTGNKLVDFEAINNKLAGGWHKLLVDQKTAYLVGNPVTIGSKDNDDKAVEMINDVLGDNFNDVLPELIKGAANKGKEWLHPYIDEEGNFDYMIISALEGIPIYDPVDNKMLIAFIRTYETDDGILKIELWTADSVTYYEKIDGKLVIDVNYEVNPAPHFYYGDTGYGWGKVPFIEFANNQERVSDLLFIKDYIDVYDRLMSDGANTLEDIQDIFYILKGYEEQDLAEFATNVRRYKAVKTSEEGGVETVQAEMPIQSLDSFLDRLERNIYQFGMGVDVGTDKFGHNPSGVALKFLYTFLDMKASVTERKFTKALQKLMWFVCEYLGMTQKLQIDYKTITFTFNKTMITNENELVEMAQNSKGIISDDTILEKHPWVTDVDVEKHRLREQNGGMVNLYTEPIIAGGGDE